MFPRLSRELNGKEKWAREEVAYSDCSKACFSSMVTHSCQNDSRIDTADSAEPRKTAGYGSCCAARATVCAIHAFKSALALIRLAKQLPAIKVESRVNNFKRLIMVHTKIKIKYLKLDPQVLQYDFMSAAAYRK